MAIGHRKSGLHHQRLFVAEVALQMFLQRGERRRRVVTRADQGGEPFLQFDMQRIDRRNADRVCTLPLGHVAHGLAARSPDLSCP